MLLVARKFYSRILTGTPMEIIVGKVSEEQRVFRKMGGCRLDVFT